MKLLVARHSQTNYNVAGICNADPSIDVHLTEAGIKQTEDLARQLQSEQIDHIFVSPMPRTRATAEIINQFHHAPVEIDGRLTENATGFEGKRVSLWREAMAASPNFYEAVFNDGESLAVASARVINFINELKTKPYKTVLLVTHGFATKAIYCHLRGVDPRSNFAYAIEQGSFDSFEL